MELRDIYDREGNPVGKMKSFGDTFEEGELRLCASLWVINPKGKILLQKRSMTKSYMPGRWGRSAGGGALAGENSVEACLREAKEEIGINLREQDITFMYRGLIDGKIFEDYFITVVDFNIEDAVLQAEEVDELRWYSLDEARQEELAFDIWELDRLEKYIKEVLK